MNQIKFTKILNKQKIARLFLWKPNWKISKQNQIKQKNSRIISMEAKLKNFKEKPNKIYRK